jgi:hypothetical protein
MMKLKLAMSAMALVALASSRVDASDALKAVVGSYLEIQARLASDSIEGIKPAARAIVEQAPRLHKGGDVEKAAKAIEQAADLKAARAAFGPLSEAVIASGTKEGWKDAPDVRVAYCPMVKASWVQKEETIRNPYYGASMLECGAFKKTK